MTITMTSIEHVLLMETQLGINCYVCFAKAILQSITAVQRTPTATTTCRGYDVRPSTQWRDWYNPVNSSRFTKRVLKFNQIDDENGTDHMYFDASMDASIDWLFRIGPLLWVDTRDNLHVLVHF